MQDGEEEELQLRMMHAPEINPLAAMIVDTYRRQSTPVDINRPLSIGVGWHRLVSIGVDDQFHSTTVDKPAVLFIFLQSTTAKGDKP